ncbi:SusC/RagA family TonB-linked outer membrane protein [Sediminicola luteus]|uniref:TonB-dependent receptor plug domain-containing protein n=1 Tax=Sediminicola luteus TaxID=319238 RepID=A0A2A4GE39_9FLAO|nr:TonB-dependent receptor [Sediminicola luteus]PCE66703.1 hypothetical protein B7P33_05275 [Sediminicola luteus]
MGKKLLTIYLMVGLLSLGQLWAQETTLKGRVLDTDGIPIPWVNILVKGTTNGVNTNDDGQFEIQLALGDTLQFSSIGFADKEVVVNHTNDLTITLKSSEEQLDEIIVVGYGTQIKSKVTSAVTAVEGEVLQNRPVASIQEALVGTAPGLNINQNNGAPGSAPNINIRGLSTIGNSSGVLVLIDGIEGSLADLNPDMVAEISVLKDASAAAIYGARGANGVILVTTKKGGKSQKMRVDFTADLGIQAPTTIPELVSGLEFMEMKNRALEYEGSLPEYSEATLALMRSGGFANTDWAKELYGQSSVRTNYALNISGGDKKTTYYLGLGALDQGGIVRGSDEFKRYNIRLKLDSQITDWLRVGTNTAWANRDRDNVLINTGRALRAAPFFPITQADGTYVVGLGGDSSNPIMRSESGSFNREDRDVMETQLYAELQLAKGLSFEQRFSAKKTLTNGAIWENAVDYITLDVGDDGYTDEIPIMANPTDRKYSKRSEKNLRLTTQSFLRYNWKNDNHFIKTLAGFQTEENKNEAFRVGRIGYLNNSIQDIDLGSDPDPAIGDGKGSTSSAAEWSIVSLFGRVNYDYKNKYFLEASFRYDGTSRFASGKKWGFFPSVSVGWNLKNEAFLQNASGVDLLKLRASVGQLGDAFKVGNYATYQTVDVNPGYVWPDGPSQGFATGRAANKDITWETATVTNLGFDASFWRGKLSLQAEYFTNKRTDILGTPDVPTEFGLQAPPQNVRDVKSWGWEFSVSHKNDIGELGYEIMVNLSDQRNELTDLGSSKPDIGNEILDQGHPVNAYYGYRTDGLITSQEDLDAYLANNTLNGPFAPYIGGVKLKDISGPEGQPDGIIDPLHDREVFDDNQNHYRLGTRLALDYKGVFFSAMIDGVLDRQVVFRGAQFEIPFSGGVGTPFAFQREAFDPAAPNAHAALPILKPELVRYDFSDYWLRDASYIRMRNISIGYDFSKKVMSRISFLQGLRLYASAENPFMIWTNYFAKDYGWDPQLPPGEVAYPLARTISMGLNVTF